MSTVVSKRAYRQLLTAISPLSVSGTPDIPIFSKTSTTTSSSTTLAANGNLDGQTQLLSRSDEPQIEEGRNLSFLLDSTVYHPLSQNDIPLAFRKSAPQVLASNTTLNDILSSINQLVTDCDFLGAAHVAAIALTSGLVKETDIVSIFKLLAIRYSCLELTGNLKIAAQEAKALEDLNSDFYYITPAVEDAVIESNDGAHPVPEHIMPFALRVQAIRLQNLGFSDPRRGVAALYDLGLECREHIRSPYTSKDTKELWSSRLASLRIHVVNALIELGNLDCAASTLAVATTASGVLTPEWTGRIVLLYIKLGMLNKARASVLKLDETGTQAKVLQALLRISEGNLQDASEILAKIATTTEMEPLLTLAKQNLAVARLYAGQITDARVYLEELVDQGDTFPSLTMNLATIYDLTTDQSRAKKVELTNRIAKNGEGQRAFTNMDFKL